MSEKETLSARETNNYLLTGCNFDRVLHDTPVDTLETRRFGHRAFVAEIVLRVHFDEPSVKKRKQKFHP